ncbi:hypothetical protein FRB99_006657 [Tulasnella sp. 403]|nr:hypothetical protein FRB99_006657 [Tulasnella sp. 403]
MTRAEFIRFSQKIQKLALDGVYFKEEFEFSEKEVEDIKSLLQGKPLLPNLREISFYYAPLEETADMVLKGSSRIETFVADLPNKRHPPPVERWIRMLHPASVRRFKLYAPLPSIPIDFTRFQRLRHLELHDDDAMLDYEWWLMLSRCQNLQTLDLDLKMMTHPHTAHSPVLFPSLYSFSIQFIHSITPWLLLHSIMPSLSHLTVVDGLESWEFCDIMAHLKQHSPYLESLHADIRADATFLMGNSIPASLAGFQLKKFSLSGLVNIVSIPDDGESFVLEHWATLLGDLNSFRLSVCYQQFAGTPVAILSPVATEETLVAILECVKGLKKLQIGMDEFETDRFMWRLQKEYGRMPVILGLDHLSVQVAKASTDVTNIGNACPRLRTAYVKDGTDNAKKCVQRLIQKQCTFSLPHM